jgi:hypothetical protein
MKPGAKIAKSGAGANSRYVFDFMQETMVPVTGIEPVTRGFSIRVQLFSNGTRYGQFSVV